MIKSLKIGLSLLVVGFLLFSQRTLIKEQFVPAFNDAVSSVFPDVACVDPVLYKIGDFSTEFGVTEKYVLDALAEAEAIWETPSGKNLFEHAPEDLSSKVVKVNLIYDYRQETTTTLKGVGSELESTRASYDELKAEFNILKNEYEKNREDLGRAVNVFEKANNEYKTKVQYWNSQGGAPEKEYNELQAERANLEKAAKQIQVMQNEVNGQVASINATVANLNRIASELNLTVDEYNTIGASRGEAFEEGVYRSDGVNKEIDIYEFSSRSKLVRVLAHELGHALGIDHVADTEGIMYELNAGKGLVATSGDLAALEAVCNPQ